MWHLLVYDTQQGVWLDDQARSLLTFSKDNDVPLAAVEFYNEPSFTIGVPANYDAKDYARDFATFAKLIDEVTEIFVDQGTRFDHRFVGFGIHDIVDCHAAQNTLT